MREPFVVVDLLGRLRDCNSAYRNMLGYGEEEFQPLTPEKWRPMEQRIIEEQILHQGFSDVYEKEYRRKDGTVFPVELRTFLIRDEAGKPVEIWAIVRDITERKLAEARLCESGERYRRLVEQMVDGLFVADRQGRYVDVNPAGCALLGMTREEVLQRSISDVVVPEDLPRLPAEIAAFADGKVHRSEWRFRRKDGSVFVGEVSGRELPDGRLQGLLRDVSERKRGEAELEQLVAERTARLQELVAELEHFSYTITHDMRAPLRAMKGFAELANLAYTEGDQKTPAEFLGRISTAADRMDRLITDALNYNRAVRQELPLEEVDAEDLLRGMLDTYPGLHASKARIQLEGKWPRVLGNQAGLTQCFSNLLENAVKFVKPGRLPEIRVWAEAREGWVRIWVEDQGVGIPRELLPKVFDMFSQGSRGYEGTGIGLALVRKVTQRMGGRVGVESEEGQGTRSWIELKLA
jgi:PAS domain S-box-containing protein